MLQVVVLPPPDLPPQIEQLRRLHDPAFHRVGAHVPLLAPFDGESEESARRLDGLACGGGFALRFGAPVAAGRALCVPVVAGAEELAALRSLLETALLPPLVEQPPAPFALRVGLFGGDAELELARRALAAGPAVPEWQVTEVTLLLEDVRGLWHPLRQKRLGPRVR